MQATVWSRLHPAVRKNWFIYLLALPGAISIAVFSYGPMYGILIAFKKYSYRYGVWGSKWVGLDNFRVLLQEKEFYRVLGNTLLINFYHLAFGFTFVLLLALLINEIKFGFFKRIVQTVVYLPHFLSWVVFAGIVTSILSPSEGIVGKLFALTGGEVPYVLSDPSLFRPLLIVSSIVKEAGFETIIYLAAIAGIGTHLYESALIDGASRVQMIRYITLPSIVPTVAVLLILRVAFLFHSNFDQVFNLYNPLVYETGDVLSTYLYRSGLLEGQFEQATALGLIFSLFGLILIYTTNKIVNRMNVTGIF